MHKKIFIAVFFVMISIPFCFMAFYKNDMSVEKRDVQDFPEIVQEGKINLKYFDELTDYFADHFAYRQELITADALMKSEVFGVSNNEKVIVGSEGWLYFNETMDDYLGRNVLSDRGIYNCAKVLSLLQEGAKKRNCKFVFTVAPNKNSLYPRNMPGNYVKESETNNYTLLREELKKQNVNTVDLHSAFLEDERVMYHKTDTHWNNQGAVFAADLIFNNLKKEHTDYNSIPYQVKKKFTADLQGMLLPKLKQPDDDVIYEQEHSYSYIGNVQSTEEMSIGTENPERDGSVVMFRDSFGNALLPYIADEFGTGYFTKAFPYNWMTLDNHNADTAIIELAERHISLLQENLPMMEAPLRNIDTTVEESHGNHSTMYVNTEEEMPVFYGEADERFLSDDGRIFVRLYNDDNSYMYEAFPASFDETKSDYCYSMNLDYSGMKPGKYDIEVVTEKEEKFFGSGKLQSLTIQ